MNCRLLLCIVGASTLVLNSAQAQNSELALKSGDRIALSIGGIPDADVTQISKVYSVSDGGTINLVHIGEVRAAGLKPSVLQRAIEQIYIEREVYTRPTITISIDGGEAPSRMVYVVSGCKKNGPVAYNAGMSIMKAVSAAGGFSDFAHPGKTKLIRNGATTEINLKDISADPSRDIKLQPEDQIIVPE
jgi:polysaccharide export outer membrane protein